MSGPIAAVIGSGPAGLRAAEILAKGRCQVTVFEQKRSVGRKFLVAGRGGLNITHSEPLELFGSRYDSPERWAKILARFSPEDLRRWFEELGVKTYVGTSGRVFPRTMRASAILEKWMERLEDLEVEFKSNHRFHQLLGQQPFDLVFQCSDQFSLITSDVVIFALGGASWPQTGSDGRWVDQFRQMGLEVRDFVPSNVGWEHSWSAPFLNVADGRPLKNVAVTCGGRSVKGELLITKYGLEGGALYQLSRELRASPEIAIDFKPEVLLEVLQRRLRQHPSSTLEEIARRTFRLSCTALALINEICSPRNGDELALAAKKCGLRLDRPRPISEAISSAGGIAWEELQEDLMLRRYPGVFCAGEMLDWDAPTGGYLLQGCFATGTLAAESALQWMGHPASG